ncbi:unnamed protein product, partial [marine sediment metagenome]
EVATVPTKEEVETWLKDRLVDRVYTAEKDEALKSAEISKRQELKDEGW